MAPQMNPQTWASEQIQDYWIKDTATLPKFQTGGLSPSTLQKDLWLKCFHQGFCELRKKLIKLLENYKYIVCEVMLIPRDLKCHWVYLLRLCGEVINEILAGIYLSLGPVTSWTYSVMPPTPTPTLECI
jgi:hypothetical protein